MVRYSYSKGKEDKIMSTNNFENSKNGIFVIEDYGVLPYADWLVEQDLEDDAESKADYEMYAERGDEDSLDMAIDDTIANIVAELEYKGYVIIQNTPYDYKVVGEHENIGLRVQGGYYADAQVIVTTQRDEQFMNANMEEEDITKDLYDFVDEQGFTEYTDDESEFEDDPEYRLNEVLHKVLWYDDTYEYVLDDMLDDDKAVIDVVSQYTTVIKKVGNFSNGEAVYKKA